MLALLGSSLHYYQLKVKLKLKEKNNILMIIILCTKYLQQPAPNDCQPSHQTLSSSSGDLILTSITEQAPQYHNL